MRLSRFEPLVELGSRDANSLGFSIQMRLNLFELPFEPGSNDANSNRFFHSNAFEPI